MAEDETQLSGCRNAVSRSQFSGLRARLGFLKHANNVFVRRPSSPYLVRTHFRTVLESNFAGKLGADVKLLELSSNRRKGSDALHPVSASIGEQRNL